MTGLSLPCNAQIYFSKKVDSYRVLNKVVDVIHEYHIEKKRNIEIVAALIRGLKNKLGLPVQYTLSGSVLTVTYKNKVIHIRNAFRVRLAEFCDLVKPDVTKVIERYGLRVNYQPLLCDLMLWEVDGGFYTTRYFNQKNSGPEQNHLKVVEDGRYRSVLDKTVYATSGRPVEAGTEILAIDGIPKRVFTTSLLDDYVYYRRDSVLRLKVMFAGDTSVVLYKNSQNAIPRAFTSIVFGDTVLYLRVVAFRSNIADSITNAYKRDSASIKHVVLDLRENSGGFLIDAYKVLNHFIKDSMVIAHVNTRKKKEVYYSSGKPLFRDQSVTVVTDSLSGSSSEIVAYTLRKHCKARIIGQKTWGKGYIQKNYYLRKREFLMHLPVRSLTIDDGFTYNKDKVYPDVPLDRHVPPEEILKYIR